MNRPRLSPVQFERFRRFIYAKSGIRIHDHKVTLLTNRIRRRLEPTACEDFDAYYRLLTSAKGGHELEFFLDAITTNETFFFRTETQFEWFRSDFIEQVVAEAREGKREARLRILSAGCANGAEPYSIAICLAENMYRMRDWSLSVLGTDISEGQLSVARAAIYRTRDLKLVPERQLRRYFRRQAEEDLWQVRPAIRNLVEFKQHNLMRPLLREAFDCIFVRNVLIYFDRDSKRVVLDNLLRSLASGGYLFVGPSEGIAEMLEPLQRISPLLYRKT